MFKIKKLVGSGKTLASGIAALLVQIATPVLRDKGVDVPVGLEDAITTVLLVFMGFVGLGSKVVRSDEKNEENVNALKAEIEELKKGK